MKQDPNAKYNVSNGEMRKKKVLVLRVRCKPVREMMYTDRFTFYNLVPYWRSKLFSKGGLQDKLARFNYKIEFLTFGWDFGNKINAIV